MRNLANSVVLAGVMVIGIAGFSITNAADDGITAANFATDGQVMIPNNWRQWIYIGTPLTPNALSDVRHHFLNSTMSILNPRHLPTGRKPANLPMVHKLPRSWFLSDRKTKMT